MTNRDLCWTKDLVGNYYVGSVVGPWKYRSAREYRSADIVNVRPCVWVSVGGGSSVPRKLVSSFHGGRVLQQVYDEITIFFSTFTYNGRGRPRYPLSADEKLDFLVRTRLAQGASPFQVNSYSS